MITKDATTGAPLETGSAIPTRAGLERFVRGAGQPLGDRAALAILLIACFCSGALLLWQMRERSFFFDEWDFVQGRTGWGAGVFLEPHNEHLHLVPVVLFKALFLSAGLTNYWPYAALLVASHIVAAVVLFLLVRRWSSNELAVAGTLVFLFLGAAWQVLVWPFMVGITVSLAAGLGALLALDQRERRYDLIATALLVLALSSASLAIPFVAGSALLLVWQRGPAKRVYVVAIPAAIYGLWYLGYGESSADLGNLSDVPVFVADAAAGALGATTGLTIEYGRVLVVIFAIVISVTLVRRWSAPAPLVTVVAIAVLMWALLGLSRLDVAPPDTSRYLYAGSALLIVALAAIVGKRELTNTAIRGVLVVIVAVSLISNIGGLDDGADGLRANSAEVLAATGAMTEIREIVPNDFQPTPGPAPTITAAAFFAATDDYGSPAWSNREIAAAGPTQRGAADETLRRAGAVELMPARGPDPSSKVSPPVELTRGEAVAARLPGCTLVRPVDGGTSIVAAVPSTGLYLRSDRVAEVRAARYGELDQGEPIGEIAPDAGTRLTAEPADKVPAWRVQLTTTGSAEVCRA